MEQATNLFTKGLLCDTNPMVLDNNTLTDCLNGTLITMNGNEVVLLNDMGNRRVDNAFLPEGYEPVGIKEYGGIIYIAAYNPITNKSQIGSFPSPLLRYGNIENISANEDKNTFTDSFPDNDFPGIDFLKNYVSLTPFLETIDGSNKKVILHAGDKFTIYNGSLSLDEITNYNNIYESKSIKKLNSPKNKKYTLSVGILNSLNEFVDFTKYLLRWELNTLTNKYLIITFPEETPDYIKFNSGYFIPNEYTPPQDFYYTILDLDFIKSRLKLAANTYAYKLVGPLYIKRELNVINNLTYNVYGNTIKVTRNNLEETDTEVYIETIYEYNCPDGTEGIYVSNNGNDKYYSFYCLKSKESIDLGSTIKYNYSSSDWINVSSNETLLEDVIYNEETNLYKAIKYTKIVLSNITSGIMDLIIVPLTSLGYGIRNLSYRDSIDISKLSSNEIELTNFRFYTNLDKNTTDITVGFKAYPKYRTSFKNLKISIYNYNYSGGSESPIKEFEWGESGYNGIKTFSWEWKDNLKSHFYPVKITYDIDNTNIKSIDSSYQNTSNIENKELPLRWIMTTKLLNDCYYSSSLNFVRDYGKYINNSFDKIIEDKLKILLSTNNTNTSDIETSDIYRDGDLCVYKADVIESNTGDNINDYTNSGVNKLINARIFKVYNENINVNGNFYLDENLYPKELELLNVIISGEDNSNKSTKLAKITKQGLIATTTGDYIFSDDTFPKEYKINNSYKRNVNLNFDILRSGLNFSLSYSTDLIGKESYLSTTTKTETIIVEKLFTSFYKYLHNENLRYAALCANSDELNTDEHCLTFSYQKSSNFKIALFSSTECEEPPYSEYIIANYGKRIDDLEGTYKYYFEKEKDYINEAMNAIFKDKLFFVGTNNNWISNYDTFYSEFPDDGDSKFVPCRPIMFWMKSLDGWAILPILKWSDYYNSNLAHPSNYELGFLGEAAHDNYNIIEDSMVKKFIRNRIKNFYYIGKNNVPKVVYSVDPSKDPIITHDIGTLNINLNFDAYLANNNGFLEGNSIQYTLRTIKGILSLSSGDTFFKNGHEAINVSAFLKDVIFNETELFQELLDSFKELLQNKIIKVALEVYDPLNVGNGDLRCNNTLHFFDKDGNVLNPNLIYLKNNDDKYYYLLDLSVLYENSFPLVLLEYKYCGIDFMYGTDDLDYYGDSNDETYLYMSSVPTIPEILLKN